MIRLDRANEAEGADEAGGAVVGERAAGRLWQDVIDLRGADPLLRCAQATSLAGRP